MANTITKADVAACSQKILLALVEKVVAVSGALVVSSDGHLLCHAGNDGASVKRLASMGSSLMSLGNTVTGELAMGRCNNVIVENEQGYAVFMQINTHLVLVAFTKQTNGLGLLLNAARSCVKDINQTLKTL